MTKDLDFILNEWKDIRSNSRDILKNIDINQIKGKLPRPELDTIMKHFEEMIDVELCYIDAITSRDMSFDTMKENYSGNYSVEEMLIKMEELDNKLENKVAESKFNMEINWFDDYKTVGSHLCALISHESFHLGQIVAFCYVNKIRIPEQLADDWALPQVETGE